MNHLDRVQLTEEQRIALCNVTPTNKDIVIAQLQDAEFRLKLHALRPFNPRASHN